MRERARASVQSQNKRGASSVASTHTHTTASHLIDPHKLRFAKLEAIPSLPPVLDLTHWAEGVAALAPAAWPSLRPTLEDFFERIL